MQHIHMCPTMPFCMPRAGFCSHKVAEGSTSAEGKRARKVIETLEYQMPHYIAHTL